MYDHQSTGLEQIIQPEAFESWQAEDANKHKPPIPEPAIFGVLLVGFCLVLYIFAVITKTKPNEIPNQGS